MRPNWKGVNADGAVKTMIDSPSFGLFMFDAVISTNHEANLTLTSQPVQTGANISDHAYMEPDTVTLDIGMTDAAVNAESSHSVNAYNLLRSIMEAREPVSLYTRLHNYTNMMIASIGAPDDYKTATALRATIMLQKILIVNVATVSVQQTVTASKTQASTGSSKQATTTKTTTAASTPAQKQSVAFQKYNEIKTAEPKTTSKVVQKVTTAVQSTLSSISNALKKLTSR